MAILFNVEHIIIQILFCHCEADLSAVAIRNTLRNGLLRRFVPRNDSSTFVIKPDFLRYKKDMRDF